MRWQGRDAIEFAFTRTHEWTVIDRMADSGFMLIPVDVDPPPLIDKIMRDNSSEDMAFGRRLSRSPIVRPHKKSPKHQKDTANGESNPGIKQIEAVSCKTQPTKEKTRSEVKKL
jgi:hypothetical protein